MKDPRKKPSHHGKGPQMHCFSFEGRQSSGELSRKKIGSKGPKGPEKAQKQETGYRYRISYPFASPIFHVLNQTISGAARPCKRGCSSAYRCSVTIRPGTAEICVDKREHSKEFSSYGDSRHPTASGHDYQAQRQSSPRLQGRASYPGQFTRLYPGQAPQPEVGRYV